jgi:hypothetical protein
MDLVQHVGALTGQRITPLRESPFDNEGRELISAERQPRWGDPDDGPGAAMPRGTLQAARGYAAQMGLSTPGRGPRAGALRPPTRTR